MGARWYSDSKRTVEQCHEVSVFFLKKHGYFCGYRAGSILWSNSIGENTGSINVAVHVDDGEQYAQFKYTNKNRSTGEETKCDYRVDLLTTPCHLGGVRYWFSCPLSGCGGRVGVLYFGGGNYLGCRHCYNLTYEVRNEPRLGRPGGIGYPIGLERKMEELYPQIKRWTWRGQPTRKARKYHALVRESERACEQVGYWWK